VSAGVKLCPANEPTVHEVRLYLCSLCLDGAGGCCNVPGCALCRRTAPDIAIRDGGMVLSIDGMPAGPYATEAESRPPTLAAWVAAAEGSKLGAPQSGHIGRDDHGRPTLGGWWSAGRVGVRVAAGADGAAVARLMAGEVTDTLCHTPATLRAALDALAVTP
jgi:hypothetical protein